MIEPAFFISVVVVPFMHSLPLQMARGAKLLCILMLGGASLQTSTRRHKKTK